MKKFLRKIFNPIKKCLPEDKTPFLFVLAAFVGIAGTLAVYIFRTLFVGIQHLIAPGVTGMTAVAHALPWWARLILPTIGGALSGLILTYGLHWAPRRSSDNYLEAITVGDGKLSFRQTILKSAASLCSIGTGASIGREGPMIQLAAMVGSLTGRALELSRSNLQLLVACGATAGLAAAYNAPIAGLLFVAEIGLGTLSRKTLAPLVIASVLSSYVTHVLIGLKPVYEMPSFSLATDFWGISSYIGLGIACGFFAPVFRQSLDWTRKAFSGLSAKSKPASLALGGLCVGAISVYTPNVWGNGYSVVNAILHEPWTWQALLLIFVLKIAATSFSYGSGAIGGVFTPTLFVGAALGSLYGQLLSTFSVMPHNLTTSYAIVGMGAFLASTTYAPLMSIMMIFEMTLRYEIVLPLMLACVIGEYVAHRFREDSIYRKPHMTGTLPNKEA